jgi:hypothetical protein
MAARTLEDKRDAELEMVRITLQAFALGIEEPTAQRISQMRRQIISAGVYQEKIEAKASRAVKS